MLITSEGEGGGKVGAIVVDDEPVIAVETVGSEEGTSGS
jgi:hypothetical protein